MHYLIEPKDRIYVKGYEFAESMSNEYCQKVFDSATHSTKTFKKFTITVIKTA